jgi:predicted enzyme related to lactoylglutathione lyase
MHNSVVFFELPADRPERAKTFYEKTFGWKIEHNPGLDIYMVGTAPSDRRGRATERGAINGLMSERRDADSTTVITIDVQDIDSAIKNVKKNGGRIVKEKWKIPGVGYAAYFKDTEGNRLQLFQSNREG